MSTQKIKTTVNGVDVEKLFETIGAIKETPGLAKFRFKVDNQWIDGGHNRTTVKNFYGAGQDNAHEKTFVFDADEPPLLLGLDRGANPVEALLHALAGCVTSALIYHAAAKGIEIEEVESSLEGDIDLHGFLGIDPDCPRGYQEIRFNFRIKGDFTDEQLEELRALGPTYSPVFDTITRAVPIKVTADRM
jgi:uncharacterized OsmC-like protein